MKGMQATSPAHGRSLNKNTAMIIISVLTVLLLFVQCSAHDYWSFFYCLKVDVAS
jgi:hypothetical protein